MNARASELEGALADLFELAFERLGEVGAALRVTFAAAETGGVDAALALEIARRQPRARCAWCSGRRAEQPVNEIAERQRAKIGNRDLQILREVASYHGLSIRVLCSKRKDQRVAVARFEAYWRLHREGRSTSDIGRSLGGRDHSTVIAGLRRFEQRMAWDRALAWRMHGMPERQAEAASS